MRCQKLTHKDNPPPVLHIRRSLKKTHKNNTLIPPPLGVPKKWHTFRGVFWFKTFLPRLVSMKFIVFWMFINLFGGQAPDCSWTPDRWMVGEQLPGSGDCWLLNPKNLHVWNISRPTFTIKFNQIQGIWCICICKYFQSFYGHWLILYWKRFIYFSLLYCCYVSVVEKVLVHCINNSSKCRRVSDGTRTPAPGPFHFLSWDLKFRHHLGHLGGCFK